MIPDGLERYGKQEWESCVDSASYVWGWFENFWILSVGVEGIDVGGEGQRAWKCLSSPLVNNMGIVPRKLRFVNSDLESRNEVEKQRSNEATTNPGRLNSHFGRSIVEAIRR